MIKRLDTALITALFALALLLRVGIAATAGFEGLYGQDAYAYYDFAAAMAQGQAPGIFFWPLGYPALLTAGFWLFGTSAAAAQAITILLGALLSPFVYILTRQMGGGRVAAFVAGVLMAICGQALQSSLVVMADIPALAWVTVSALCLWRYIDKLEIQSTAKTPSSPREDKREIQETVEREQINLRAQHVVPLQMRAIWLVLSAVTLALACITRWLCLIFVPVWGIALLPHLAFSVRGKQNRGDQQEDGLSGAHIGAPLQNHDQSALQSKGDQQENIMAGAHIGAPLQNYDQSALQSKGDQQEDGLSGAHIGAPLQTRFPVRWRDVLLAGLWTLIVFIPQLLYSYNNPYPTLNHAWVEGWSLANMTRSEFINADGHFIYDKINAVYYAQVYSDGYYLAPVWTPFLLLGVIWLAHKRQLQQWVFLVAWALLPYLFLAGIPYQNIRFPLIVFPAVAALTGLGVEGALAMVQGFGEGVQRRARRTLPLQEANKGINPLVQIISTAVLLGIGAIGLWQSYSVSSANISSFLHNQQQDRETAAWAAERIPEGARVYTFSLTPTLRHYTTFEVYDLYYQSPESLSALWRPGVEDYLLINGWNVVNQWEGRAPHIAYRWLRRERGLTEIGRFGYYTLYRVSG